MTLGECISEYIKEHNLSMRAFADMAGVSHSYVSYIIKGKTPHGKPPVPTIDRYRGLAKAMGMDVNELIAKVDDRIAWGEGGQMRFAAETGSSSFSTDYYIQQFDDSETTEEQMRLLKAFYMLNDEGRAEATNRIEEMTQLQRFTEGTSSARVS